MSFAFQAWPWLLAAIPAVGLALWLALTSRTNLVRWRFASSLGLRLGMIAALILALAGLTVVRTRDELGVFFVVDLSKSIQPDDQAFALDWVAQAVKTMEVKRDRAGLIVFGTDAAVEQPLDRALDPRKITAVVGRDHTDLSQAVRLAAASFPSDVQRRIVIVTDGQENLGDGLEAAREARAAGIDVWVRPLESLRGRDAAVEKVVIPGEAKTGEAFDVRVHTRFTGARPGEKKRGTLRLWRNRRLVGNYEVELAAGEDVFSIPQKITPDEGAGGYEYEAALEAADDAVGENNRAFGYTHVEGEARVLLVEGRPGESRDLEAALRAGGVTNLDAAPAGRFPVTMAELQIYDVVILNDVPAEAFTPGETGQVQLIKDYVESHGGGLIMLGGERSFGPGGWFRTPVEEALPVTMDIRQRKIRASMALVIAIDQSGSMSMTVGGQTKISLANEAAVRVVEMLDDRDKVGVLYVDTAPKWAVKIQPATDGAKRGIYADIRANRGGGGGIYVHTALHAAYEALDQVEAMIRHVILFSDASDSEQQEHCIDRALAERKKGRTLTVIGMGRPTDQHGPFLEDLARAGDGRIVFVEDVRKLPAIFTAETMTAGKSAIVEADFVPALSGPSSIVQGIDWASAPQLHGYVTTTLKPRGEMLLRGTEDDPVLAKWQCGLGRAAVFTSDATARWAKDWLGWEGYRRLWPQMVRWCSRRRSTADHRMGLHFDRARGKIVLDAFDAKGEPRNFLDLTARVSGQDGRPAALKLVQRGSGRYEAEFPAETSGAYFVTVADRDGAIVGQSGGAVSYPAEYRAPDARPTLVEDIVRATGGRKLDLPRGIFEHTAAPAKALQDAWPFLLWTALALLMLDVACRRIAVPELAAKVAGWFTAPARSAAAKAPASPTMERLQAAKASADREVAERQAPAAGGGTLDRLIEKAAQEGTATPAAPPVEASAPPPAPPAAAEPGGYLQRLIDAKKKAKGP